MILSDSFDPQNLFHYLNTAGVIGLLVFILVGGYRKWWVFGWQFKDMEDRLEKVEQSNVMWMQLALRGANVTEQIIKTVATHDDPQQN